MERWMWELKLIYFMALISIVGDKETLLQKLKSTYCNTTQELRVWSHTGYYYRFYRIDFYKY